MVWTHLGEFTISSTFIYYADHNAVEHCMEDLRQTIMCKADFSLLTYDWIPNYRKPWPNFKMDHECVDWKAFDDWAGERSFSLFDQKSLVHPELGKFLYTILATAVPSDLFSHKVSPSPGSTGP